MGIGISFTGRDGATRTMQAESPQEVRSALELAMGANSQTMGALGRRASRSQQHITNITNILKQIQKEAGDGGDNPEGGEGKVEIDPNGSLTEGLQGLALKGDMPDGMARLQVYGETDGGKRGFWPLEVFDPVGKATATPVGDSASQSEDADNSERKRGSREPFSLPVVTRIAIVEDKNLSEFVHVYFFMRYVSFTGFGRACGISRETRIPLGMLNLNGGGDGGTPDDVSIEVLEGDDESKKLQIKGFDLEHDEELADVDIPTLLGLPVNACASSETPEAQTFFLAKRQIPSPSSSSSSSSSANEPTGKSLEYLPPRKVNMRPLLFNKVKQCDFVANGDDTDIEIYVPSLMPAPESGITIATDEDSEGYPIIIIGYEGGGGGGGSSTTGYSSSKHSGVYVPDMSVYSFRYSEHNLQVKYCREVWEDGLLKSRAIDSSWTTVTTAVEESVCHCGSSDGGQNGGSSQS